MKKHLKQNAFFYILILGLGAFSTYQYFKFNYQLSNVKDAWEEQRQEVGFYTKQAMDSSSIGALKFATKSLVWAVRSEMLSENHEQLNRYISDLEKDARIGQVLICDTTSTIRYASEKELIGKPFTSLHNQRFVELTDITVEMGETGTMHLVAPITGLNARVGTLFLTYRHEVPQILRSVKSLEEH
ncbi:MAG: hypothetical protein ACPGJS_01200 [Flammeovirgaceae bacterium]